MIGLYDLVAARLKATNLFSMVEAGHSMDAAEVFSIGRGVGALVCPLTETAGPVPEGAMVASQQVVERFGVVLSMTFPSSFPEFEPARAGAKATLRGWQPHPEADGPIVFNAGRTLIYDVSERGGEWRYLLEFSVPTQDRIEHQL